jgi:hypothetical protein
MGSLAAAFPGLLAVQVDQGLKNALNSLLRGWLKFQLIGHICALSSAISHTYER